MSLHDLSLHFSRPTSDIEVYMLNAEDDLSHIVLLLFFNISDPAISLIYDG